jgi:Flp pilus assembly protein TadD
VFWVHASNAARFEQSYRDIADRVKIFGRRDPQADIFKLVYNWLCNSRQQWLLVLDNVDDARFLLSGQADGHNQGQPTNAQAIQKPLREYLPHCERGSIIVTTRNKEAALKLVELRDITTLEPMDEPQAIELCEKKLGSQGDNQYNKADAAELAATLEYMPLAIVQAVAYILQRAPRCSITKYLDEYKKSEHKKKTLLDYDKGQLRRDLGLSNSIIMTWQISFEYIQQTRPSAADLLSLMSFFDRQGIPEALLQTRPSPRGAQRSQKEPKRHKENNASQSSTGDNQFEEDIVALRNFCFISDDTSGTSFEMHALVQLATRVWLGANNRLEQWKQQFVSNLCAAFPTGKYENWAVCRALFAHAKVALEQRPHDDSLIADWATILYRAAWYAESTGNVADAVTLATEAWKAREKMLGNAHEDTIQSIAMVANAYSLGGRWDEAETLRRQVMETSKKKLGADHPSTLTSINNLAVTYSVQGRWEDARKLQVQVMETRKKKLGADHPSTLTSMANLASTYRKQGRWDAAEELEVQVMETSKKKLGADHPDTLTSMANLASTYRNQGRWDAAEELEVQVMETSKKKLGADNPSTLRSMGRLAATYQDQGRWDAAEELEVQVMEMSKKKLGADHPDTLTSMANLAFTWKAQGRIAEAVVLMRQCVQQRQQVLKAGHPSIVSSSTVLEKWEAE